MRPGVARRIRQFTVLTTLLAQAFTGLAEQKRPDPSRNSELSLRRAKTLVFDQRWSGQTAQSPGAWMPIPGSSVEGTTTGRPLQISMDLSLQSLSNVTCRPVVDGVWAGDFSGQPKSVDDPFWTEGIFAISGSLAKWSSTRLYPGIPAGVHTFSVQCAVPDSGWSSNPAPNVFSSWTAVEIH